MDNSNWLVGNGKVINCWLDNWCGEVLAQSLNLTPYQLNNLPMKLCNFIQNGRWLFASDLQIQFPNLVMLAAKVTIPTQSCRDKLI